MSCESAMMASVSPDKPARPRGRPPRRVEDPDTARELKRISGQIRKRQATVSELETKRNELILRALEQGWTHAQLAEATGLTRARIGQLAL